MAQPKKRPFVSLKGLETGRVTSAGKPVYKYKGEEISEKSIDIEADGKTYVIPTVIDGKLYTEEAAVKKFFNKEVEPIKVLKENIKERSKKLAKGGTAMKRQMEMFEDGGLKDEGGMVDEVSGNDVPTGSTREEVRDDIPAQLSEGEFVFPADVVRFIGLEKLMRLRQEAKQGLKQMEAMGQMGNSDEATMPDDLPFDETDLDIEDDLEYNVGGYVAPQVPNINESIETTSPMGMQQIQSGLGRMYTPTGEPPKVYAPSNYEQFLGPSAGGAPRTQNVRYFNASTGQTRMIPHVVNADGSLGQTIYPVPNGFVRQDEAPKEEAKTVVDSTKVKPVDSGDNNDSEPTTSAVDPAGDPLSYGGFGDRDNLDTTMKSLGNMQVGMLTKVTGFAPAISAVASGMQGKPAANDMTVGAMVEAYRTAKAEIGKVGQNVANLTGYERDVLDSAMVGARVAVNQLSRDAKGDKLGVDEIADKVNALAEKYGVKDRVSKRTNVNRQVSIGKVIAQIERAKDLERQKEMEKMENVLARQKDEERSAKGRTGGTADVAAQKSYEAEANDPDSGVTGQDFSQDAYDDPMMNTGGLASKKQKKTKKMKRGGLASKK